MLAQRVLLCGCVALFAVVGCDADDTSSEADAAALTVDATAASTWTNFAGDFFETFCQECHGPGDALRDYSVLTMIRAEKDKIRCGVSPTTITGCSIPARQFPIGSGAKPTDAEREELVRWIEDGALE